VRRESLKLARLCVKLIGHMRQSQNLTEVDLKVMLGDEYEETVALIESFKQKCPSCGCNAEGNFRFCTSCGYRRPGADAENQPGNAAACPQCGRVVLKSTESCLYCGWVEPAAPPRLSEKSPEP
jgi:RNA polymerase subunit RPABC4/transcription elongation factor Spt4